jgi:hypothetical protein
VTGITTAIVRRNAVLSHCPALTVMPRSWTRRGMATPVIVSLRMTTNAETMRRRMTRRSFAETSGSAGNGAGLAEGVSWGQLWVTCC